MPLSKVMVRRKNLGKEPKQIGELFSHWISSLIGLTTNNEQARASFMSDQNSLTILSKQHQIPFPMTCLAPLVDVGRAPIDGHSVLDMIHRATAFVSTPTALAFSTGQIVPPAEVLGAADLRIDKPIDRLIADHRTSLFLLQSSAT